MATQVSLCSVPAFLINILMRYWKIFSRSGSVSLSVALCLATVQGSCIHMPTRPFAVSGDKIHVINPGESLSLISRKYKVPIEVLIKRNRIKDPHLMEVGQVLYIPKRPKAPAYRNSVRSSGGLLFGGNDFLWPVKGEISSGFGLRNGRPHEGIDIRAPRGRKVRAALKGKVTFSGWKNGYGRTVIIEHNGYSTLYAHLDRIHVKAAQFVERGSVVGRVGRSGRSTGYHLHFEIRKGTRALNPLSFYKAGS